MHVYVYLYMVSGFHLQIHAYDLFVYKHVYIYVSICIYSCLDFPGRRDRYERDVKLYWYEKAPEGMMLLLACTGISGSLYSFGCPKNIVYIHLWYIYI